MGTVRLATAMVLTLAGSMPVQARDWSRDHDHHHASGAALLGVALLGGLAAVAATSGHHAAPEPIDYRPDLSDAPVDYDDPYAAAAVDRCIDAVGENFAHSSYSFARVEDIGPVEPTDKGYRVRGHVRIVDVGGFSRFSKFRCSINRSGTSRSLTVG